MQTEAKVGSLLNKCGFVRHNFLGSKGSLTIVLKHYSLVEQHNKQLFRKNKVWKSTARTLASTLPVLWYYFIATPYPWNDVPEGEYKHAILRHYKIPRQLEYLPQGTIANWFSPCCIYWRYVLKMQCFIES